MCRRLKLWQYVGIVAVALQAQRVATFATPTRAKPNVGFLVEDDFYLHEGRAIAEEVKVSIISSISDSESLFTHVLRLVPFEVSNGDDTYALAIEECNLNPDRQGETSGRRRRPKQTPRPKPFFIDLCPSKNSKAMRRGSSQGGSDMLVKAVGPKKCSMPGNDGAVVFDLTAGLGQDSIVLALNGASAVYMVERDPIIAAMLRDALRRLDLLTLSNCSKYDSTIATKLRNILNLREGESIGILKAMMEDETIGPPDVVYLDPMFPARTKSSKVKKGMSLLHGLLETQEGDLNYVAEKENREEQLLADSYRAALSRVVVKRPAKAPPLGPLGALEPSYSINGSVNRWDVYVK